MWSLLTSLLITANPDVADTFIRLERTAEGPRALQTAVATYVDDEGRHVALVGAVHLADPAYYRRVQRLLDTRDVVLVEGVRGAKAAEVARGGMDDQDKLVHVLGLTAEELLALQERGLGGRQHFGCGVLSPWERRRP